MSRQKGDIMREVMISIQPKWVEKICRKEKTVEVRKTKPKCELPFKCYIYCTKGKPTFTQSAFCDDISNGKVIGEFVCDRIYDITPTSPHKYDCGWNVYEEHSRLTFDEFRNYLREKNGYGWHITDLVVYDEPRGLGEFEVVGCQGCRDKDTYHCKFHCFGRRRLKRPPQSWCYIEPRQTAD